jgi:hypothetical protein
LSGGAPTPATRTAATATVLVALLLLGVEALRRRTLREFPDADRAAAAQRRRERFAGISAGAAENARAGSSAVVRQTSRFSPAAPQDDVRLERLERLAQLRAVGVIDDEELRAEKARVLTA